MNRLDELRVEAADCRACPLWKTGTQTVFGEGAAHATVMLVGEQPGDQEDKAGRPFVGPAGRFARRGARSGGEAGRDRLPRAILRQRTDEDRHWEMDAFVRDLRLVATVLD